GTASRGRRALAAGGRARQYRIDRQPTLRYPSHAAGGGPAAGRPVLRVAALYDIHGNLRALEAVLAEVAKLRPDRILVGGDVALGPMPRRVLELLAALDDRVVYLRGNCDREMVAALRSDAPAPPPWGARTRWAAEHCTPAQIQLLGSLPT